MKGTTAEVAAPQEGAADSEPGGSRFDGLVRVASQADLVTLDQQPAPAWCAGAQATLAKTDWVAALEADSSLQMMSTDEYNAQMSHLPYRSFTFYRPLLQFLLVFYYPVHEEHRMYAVCYFSEFSEGPPNFAHGGAVGAAFDELLGFTCLCNGAFGPTLQLQVTYRRGTPLHRPLFMEGQLTRLEGRKVHLEGVLRDNRDKGSTVYAEVKAMWYNMTVSDAGRRDMPTQIADSLEKTDGHLLPFASTVIPAWVKRMWSDEHLVSLRDSLMAGSNTQTEDYMRAIGFVGRNFITLNGKVKFDPFHRSEDNVLLCIIEVSDFVQGPLGCVNGGCIYACLDNVAGWASWAVHGLHGFTRTMEVRFHKFTPIAERFYLLEARLQSVDDKRCVIESTLVNPTSGVVHCTATTEFVVSSAGRQPKAAL